jgi:two-component system response regulator (stage 0 sporulation protein F)
MGKIRILLVDDEEGFRQLIGILIREWGYYLIEASNGQEAIDAFNNEHPDIVILDYLMPDTDGITVLKHLRKINKDISVIMFTSYPDGKSIIDAEELGISAYIPKLNVYSAAHSALKETLNTLVKRLDREKKTNDR